MSKLAASLLTAALPLVQATRFWRLRAKQPQVIAQNPEDNIRVKVIGSYDYKPDKGKKFRCYVLQHQQSGEEIFTRFSEFQKFTLSEEYKDFREYAPSKNLMDSAEKRMVKFQKWLDAVTIEQVTRDTAMVDPVTRKLVTEKVHEFSEFRVNDLFENLRYSFANDQEQKDKMLRQRVQKVIAKFSRSASLRKLNVNNFLSGRLELRKLIGEHLAKQVNRISSARADGSSPEAYFYPEEVSIVDSVLLAHLALRKDARSSDGQVVASALKQLNNYEQKIYRDLPGIADGLQNFYADQSVRDRNETGKHWPRDLVIEFETVIKHMKSRTAYILSERVEDIIKVKSPANYRTVFHVLNKQYDHTGYPLSRDEKSYVKILLRKSEEQVAKENDRNAAYIHKTSLFSVDMSEYEYAQRHYKPIFVEDKEAFVAHLQDEKKYFEECKQEFEAKRAPLAKIDPKTISREQRQRIMEWSANISQCDIIVKQFNFRIENPDRKSELLSEQHKLINKASEPSQKKCSEQPDPVKKKVEMPLYRPAQQNCGTSLSADSLPSVEAMRAQIQALTKSSAPRSMVVN